MYLDFGVEFSVSVTEKDSRLQQACSGGGLQCLCYSGGGGVSGTCPISTSDP